MMLGSITLVAVLQGARTDVPHGTVPEASAIMRYADALARCAADVEIVLVASGVSAGTALMLKAFASTIPDLTVVFLSQSVHDDVARLVGIEHAVGDAVLFADVMRDDPADLPSLLGPLCDGYDLVIADPAGRSAHKAGRRRALVYPTLFRLLTGTVLERRPTGLRVLTRAASLHVSGRPDAEMVLRARTLGPTFPAKLISLPPGRRPPAPSARHTWAQAIGLLLSTSALPLRGASYAAALGGLLSALYSLYVFAVFLLKNDVAAGWTTLSFQLSGMMFVFSVVLLFLSEYVIQIYAGAPPRSRRHLVVREVRSALSRRAERLNVVDAEGRFQLGKPAWLET
jgi:hypothetical protein